MATNFTNYAKSFVEFVQFVARLFLSLWRAFGCRIYGHVY